MIYDLAGLFDVCDLFRGEGVAKNVPGEDLQRLLIIRIDLVSLISAKAATAPLQEHADALIVDLARSFEEFE